MKNYSAPAAAVLLCGLFACDSGPRSPVGFRLPEGDIEQGRTAFLELQCNGCHSVAGEDLPPPLWLLFLLCRSSWEGGFLRSGQMVTW